MPAQAGAVAQLAERPPVDGWTRGRDAGSIPAGVTRKEGREMELQIMIGHVLRQHRLAKGMTLRDVGDGAHVSYSYLSEVERGLKPISSDAIWSLCQALDLPLSALLAEVGDLMEALEKGELFARAS